MRCWNPLGFGLTAVVAASCAEPRDATLDNRASLIWAGEQRLVADDAAELDQFGWSVSLAGDRALVGAFGDSDGRGAAYVFVRNGNAWVEEQKLVASDGAELDRFGWSVSLAGDRALVGAYGANGVRGAAYVFGRRGGAWTEEQKLVASDGAEVDNFGWSVSLTDDRALVGAYGSDSARGAAYVFVHSGTSWAEEQKLIASDGVADDDFGNAVSLATDRAVVGAPGDDGYRGAAYAFVRSGAAPERPWAEEQKLVASDGVGFDNFGNAVSLAADRAVVGAYWDDDLRGAAYVFTRSGAATERPWAEEQKLVASDGAAGNRFGNAISLAADHAVIGAFAIGAAYVFARSGSDGKPWTQEQRLIASDGSETDLFGWSVSLAAGRALIGANYADQLRGAADVFSLGVDTGDAGSGDADVADGHDGGPIEAGTPAPGSCTRGDDCESGHCEDALCCDRTCAANERCRANLKVAGGDGTCGPAAAAALGAPCRFDVQCTSGVCADGACVSGSGPRLPGDDGGCGCRAVGSPTKGPQAWLGVALVLLLLSPLRRMGEVLCRRCWHGRL